MLVKGSECGAKVGICDRHQSARICRVHRRCEGSIGRGGVQHARRRVTQERDRTAQVTKRPLLGGAVEDSDSVGVRDAAGHRHKGCQRYGCGPFYERHKLKLLLPTAIELVNILLCGVSRPGTVPGYS